MKFRFLFEAIAGLICLLVILFFGEEGRAIFIIFVALPIILRRMKVKPDERELQLFYKTGNVTLGAIIIALVLISSLSSYSVNGIMIGNNWLLLSIASLVFFHGAAGYIALQKF